MSSRLHPEESSEKESLMDPEVGGHAGSRPSSRRQSETASNPDFMMIKIIARMCLSVIRRFWAFSGAALLALILFYWLYGGLLALAAVVFGVSGVLYKAGDKLLYHPDQPPHSRVFVPTPAMFDLPFDNLFIPSRDGTLLHLFLVKQPGDKSATVPTILYFHGNAGNIGHRLLNVQGLYNTIGCNIALLEYRGYGRSEGSPGEEGIYMDAQAGLDFLLTRQDIATDKIVVFGRSLGGAVAVDLATRSANKDSIAALMLENTFTSIPDIARVLFPIKLIQCLPVWFYKNQFKSHLKSCRITQPTLFLSGLSDKLIPPKMMNDLYISCGAPVKKLARFPGGTHNETWTMSNYYQTINYFLDEVLYLHLVSGRPRVESPSSFVQHGAVHNV